MRNLLFFCLFILECLGTCASRRPNRVWNSMPARTQKPPSNVKAVPLSAFSLGHRPCKSKVAHSVRRPPRFARWPSSNNKGRDLPLPLNGAAKSNKPYNVLKSILKLNDAAKWVTRFQYWNITYPNPIDVTGKIERNEQLVLCVNIMTDESKYIQTQSHEVVRVTGNRKTYYEQDLRGFTYSVLQIPEDDYNFFQNVCNTMTECANHACRVQPGPMDWYWRYELEPTTPGARPRVMPGVSDVTIERATAQTVANRWPPCCAANNAGRRWATKKQQSRRDMCGENKLANLRREPWLARIAIVSEWNLNNNDIANATGQKECVRIVCVRANSFERTKMLLTKCAKGRQITYSLKGRLEGLIFKTQEIDPGTYESARSLCLRYVPNQEQFYVQPYDAAELVFEWSRFEIKQASEGALHAVMPGVAQVLVPHALAQRYVDQGGTFPPPRNARVEQKEKDKKKKKNKG